MNTTIDPQAVQLLSHLHRGGKFAYWWIAEGKKSLWWRVGNPSPLPNGRSNVYFGVHPAKAERGVHNRSRIEDVTAINCLFSEFDAKDFSGDKPQALAHIKGLSLLPNVLVDSGGGYHCYWLLQEPFIIANAEDRERAKRLQAAWVKFTGGDGGAKDLARVLRVPGTKNYKPERGPDFPTVTIVWYQGAEYALEELEEEMTLYTAPAESATLPHGAKGDPRERYAQAALQNEIEDVHRARNGNRNDTLNKAAFALGQLVGAGALNQFEVESALHDAAVSVGLGEREARATIRSGLTAGLSEPRVIPQVTGGASRAAKRVGKKADPEPPRPTDDELAEIWRQSHPLTAYSGEFRRYAAGLWQAVDDVRIDGEITAVLVSAKSKKIRPSARLLSSVERFAKIGVYVPPEQWDADPDLLVFKNGTLHIPTLTLRPHSPDDYQTSGLDFDYDPKAEAPVWNYFLQTTVLHAADFLQEFAGYSLTVDTKFEIAVWLYGPPGSGKSTLLTGLQAMLGNRAGLLGLADIERSRFALADLPGKTLAVSTEQPATYMTATHILNAIISGEPVTVDRKYRDAVTIIPRAKLAWAMNELPRVPDAGNGLFRRVKVVKFPPLADDPDPKIKETIKTEGAGILNWALAGLARLRARGRFDVPSCVQDATAQFQTSNDVPALFVAECCLTGPKYTAQAGFLYTEYVEWCKTNGHKPQSATSLAGEWERLGFEGYKAAGKKFYRGVGLPTKATLEVGV
jgi:putative DNA primase/helicase